MNNREREPQAVTEEEAKVFKEYAEKAEYLSTYSTKVMALTLLCGGRDKGNLTQLTQLKKAGLVETCKDVVLEEITWLKFTEAGLNYARDLGIDTTKIGQIK